MISAALPRASNRTTAFAFHLWRTAHTKNVAFVVLSGLFIGEPRSGATLIAEPHHLQPVEQQVQAAEKFAFLLILAFICIACVIQIFCVY